MSAIEKLEKRLTALEAEVQELKQRFPGERFNGHAWLDKIFGSFADDRDYEEAMRLGRKYRESLKPKHRTRKKRKATHVDS